LRVSFSCSASDCLRARELHQLDLLELVLANDAAHVLPIGAGLRAEARRIRGQQYGQFRFVERLVAIEVRHRDFGGGDEPVVVVAIFARHETLRVGAAEEVFGKLRELAGSEQRFAVHHEGRQDFGVAVLARVKVEHEADQRALELRAVAPVDGEAGAGNFRRAFQVEDAELRAQFPMWFRLKRIFRDRSPSASPRRSAARCCQRALRRA
jgi:hypothetical protein